MILQSLHLADFRIYREADLRFSPGMNLILGENAQGKTNLIESIWCLSGAKSFRTSRDAELVRFGAEAFSVEAKGASGRREFDIRMQYKGHRRVWVNGVAKQRVSDAAGTVQTVLFCPEDLELVKGGAAQRRRFIDNALCQLRPGYAAQLARYNRLQAQISAILGDEEGGSADTLDTFAYQLFCAAARIIPYRFAFCGELAHDAADIHGDIACGREALRASYVTVNGVDPAAKPEEIGRALWDHYLSHRTAMLSSRQLLTGPHKDDFFIELKSGDQWLEARKYASQGQARTGALALKLAERRIFRRNTGEYPILLLDDVLSELDPSRKKYLLDNIREGQIFVTSCEEGEFLQSNTDCARFLVENGTVTGGIQGEA